MIGRKRTEELAVLLEIRNLLRAILVEVRQPPDHDEDDGCPHPVEARANLSGMGDPVHFVCRICGLEVRELRES